MVNVIDGEDSLRVEREIEEIVAHERKLGPCLYPPRESRYNQHQILEEQLEDFNRYRLVLNRRLWKYIREYGIGEVAQVGDLARYEILKIISLLESPEFMQALLDGKITVGAIKPHTELSRIGTEDDNDATNFLMHMIGARKPKPYDLTDARVEEDDMTVQLMRAAGSPLHVLFSFSCLLDGPDVLRFYPEELHEKLSDIPYTREPNMTVWDSFSKFMRSGPVTYFVMHSNADAIPTWRRIMGDTNPEKADPRSIRGRWANTIQNNLVHGSSELEGAQREIAFILSKMMELALPRSEHPISEKLLKQFGLVPYDTTVQLIQLIDVQIIDDEFKPRYRIFYQDCFAMVQHVDVIWMGSSQFRRV
jgi:nucleoside diphosphate kinase